MKKTLLFSGALLLMLGLAYNAMASLTFFSSDVGLRFLQIQNLVDQRWRTLAIDYPARVIDPELAHVPYYYAYSVVSGEIYFNISPFFPLLVSFGYATFGLAGLPIVPVAGSVITAWATYRLIQLRGLPYAPLAFITVLFTTPLFFYGLVLWDHSLGAALALLAVYGVAQGIMAQKVEDARREYTRIFWFYPRLSASIRILNLFYAGRFYLLGGLAAGVAIGQRPELYLFAAALGSGLIFWRQPRWRALLYFALGGLLGALPMWWLQYRWVGHPLGMALAPHLLGYGTPPGQVVASGEIPLLTKWLHLLIHTDPRARLQEQATLAVLLGGAILLLIFWSGRRWARYGLFGGLLLLVYGYLLLARIALTSALVGIIPTFPLVPFALLGLLPKVYPLLTSPSLGEELSLRLGVSPLPSDLSLSKGGADARWVREGLRLDRLILWTALSFLALIFALWPGFGGLQWGARYLLPLYPLLVYLAWVGYTAQQNRLSVTWQPLLRLSALTLLVLGLVIEGMGAYRIFVDHPKHRLIREQLLAMPVEWIATNHTFMPSFMTSVNGQKNFLYVRDSQQLAGLLARLAEQGIDHVGVIPWSEASLRGVKRFGDYRVEQSPVPADYLIQYVYELKRKNPE